MLTKQQRSEINRSANQMAQGLAKELAHQTILLKQLNREAQFNLNVVWSDAEQKFVSRYVSADEDKF